MTPAQFRAQYPAFQDSLVYPDAMVNGFLTVASQSLSARRWGQFWLLGIGLWAAHFMVLFQRDNQTALKGGTPGLQTGLVVSKSVQGVSISYDASGSSEKDGGHWNMTSFGKQYLRFARMVGIGGVQIATPAPIISVPII